MKTRFYCCLTFALLVSVTSSNAKQLEGPLGGGGGGGAGVGNNLSISWDSTLCSTNDKLSTIRLFITGLAGAALSQTVDTPHTDSLLGQNWEVGASGLTSYSSSLSGSTGGLLTNATASSFFINSSQIESVIASSHRQHLNTVARITLKNRVLTPDQTAYEAYTGYLMFGATFAGGPINLIWSPFGSGSRTKVDMPRINGIYEHSQAVNGNLVVTWYCIVVDPDGQTVTHFPDPNAPWTLPLFSTETTITFQKNTQTSISEFTILLDPVFSIDSQSNLFTAFSGFGFGSSMSGGNCIVATGSSSFFVKAYKRESQQQIQTAGIFVPFLALVQPIGVKK